MGVLGVQDPGDLLADAGDDVDFAAEVGMLVSVKVGFGGYICVGKPDHRSFGGLPGALRGCGGGGGGGHVADVMGVFGKGEVNGGGVARSWSLRICIYGAICVLKPPPTRP